LGQLLRRQLAQLLVDQRQQFLGRVRIALVDGVQYARNLAHGVQHNRRSEARQGWEMADCNSKDESILHRALGHSDCSNGCHWKRREPRGRREQAEEPPGALLSVSSALSNRLDATNERDLLWWFIAADLCRSVAALYTEGVASHSPGSRSAPWVRRSRSGF